MTESSLGKFIKDELLARETDISKFSSEAGKLIFKRKMITFTIIFTLICIENSLHIVDYIYGWSEPIEPEVE